MITERIWLQNLTIGSATLVVAILGGAIVFPIIGILAHMIWHMVLMGWSWVS